jgi:hypothetical protein
MGWALRARHTKAAAPAPDVVNWAATEPAEQVVLLNDRGEAEARLGCRETDRVLELPDPSRPWDSP